jgi:hypothetical protein
MTRRAALARRNGRMNNTRTIAAVAGALAMTVAPVAAVAQGAGAPAPAKTAKVLGKAERQGKKAATLKVRYSCATGSTLWISLKQAKAADKDPALKKEGSSAVSAAWLQSHRNKITCDGKNRTATFSVDKVEQGSKGTLKKGVAWMQFCVTEGDALTVSVAKWVRVN